MNVFEIVCAVAMILISILVVFLVAIQEPKGDGLSALAGGNSFLSTHLDRSTGAILGRITKGLVVAFFVLTILVYGVSVFL